MLDRQNRTISIRLSLSTLAKLDDLATEQGKDRTQVIREAIDNHLDPNQKTIEERLECLEERESELTKATESLKRRLEQVKADINSVKKD